MFLPIFGMFLPIFGTFFVIVFLEYVCKNRQYSPLILLTKLFKRTKEIFIKIGKYLAILFSYIIGYPIWKYLFDNFKKFLQYVFDNFKKLLQFFSQIINNFIICFNKILPNIIKVYEFITDILHIISDIVKLFIKILFSPFYIIRGYISEITTYKYYIIVLIVPFIIYTLLFGYDQYNGKVLDVFLYKYLDFLSSFEININYELIIMLKGSLLVLPYLFILEKRNSIMIFIVLFLVLHGLLICPSSSSNDLYICYKNMSVAREFL
jgi:hypothetical protein